MSERKSSENDSDAAVPEASDTATESDAETSADLPAPTDDEDRTDGRGDASDSKSAPSTRGGGKGWAVLALLVAIAALALATRPFWSGSGDAAPVFSADDARQLDERVADRLEQRLGDRIDALQARLDELEGLQESLQTSVREQASGDRPERVAAMGARLDELAGRIESIGEGAAQVEALTRRVGRLEGTQSSAEASLEARMAALEQRIEQRVEGLQQRLGTLGDDLEQAGRESARRMALVHARALLLQGRDRLELNGDVDAARAAWSRAAERLSEFGTGESAQAVEALDRLVDAAGSLEAVDTAGRVERLDALAAAVDDWPADRPADTAENTTDSGDAAGAGNQDEAGWRDRVGSALGRLVRVENLDAAAPNPAEVDRARERIQAALAAAAVAAARSDHATVAVLVERAARDMRAYLDDEADVVRRALQQLDELSRIPAEPAVPDAFDAALSAVEEGLESAR